MNNIIISNTSSRFLDNLKIAMYHHKERVSSYNVDLNEIFKAYDVLKPSKICISGQDLQIPSVAQFYKQCDEIEKSKFLIDNYNYLNIINLEIFKKYQSPRNNHFAILLDNIDSLPKSMLDTINNSAHSIHMFNNPKIKHPYNLGTVLEHQKAFIFSTYKYVIGKNQLYKNESILCGAIYMDIDTELNDQNHTLDTDIIDIHEYIQKELYA